MRFLRFSQNQAILQNIWHLCWPWDCVNIEIGNLRDRTPCMSSMKATQIWKPNLPNLLKHIHLKKERTKKNKSGLLIFLILPSRFDLWITWVSNCKKFDGIKYLNNIFPEGAKEFRVWHYFALTFCYCIKRGTDYTRGMICAMIVHDM